MTFALKELRNLLTKNTILDGVVSSVGPAAVQVATAQGVVLARFSTPLGVGDPVRIEGGIAHKLSKPTRTYPV